MKTPIQELIETFEEMRSPIDGKVDVDFAISLIKSMLEKEKDVMCEFADEFSRECIDFHHAQTMSPEKFYEITFNTNEK